MATVTWIRNVTAGALGAVIAAACGQPDESHKPGSTGAPTAIVRTALSSNGTGWARVVTGTITPVVDFPYDKICMHRRADTSCIVPTPNDEDADGFPAGRDCNDHDPNAYPGAPETTCDGVDEDCDGVDPCPPDEDQDGFSPPSDCDDKDPTRNPGALEVFCNGADENCNGVDDCDADNDGDAPPGDCNDHDPSISLHAAEILCDRIDQDCNGSDCCANDEDGDGAPCSADCDDKDPKAYPGAPVPDGCYNKDMDCDGRADGVCH